MMEFSHQRQGQWSSSSLLLLLLLSATSVRSFTTRPTPITTKPPTLPQAPFWSSPRAVVVPPSTSRLAASSSSSSSSTTSITAQEDDNIDANRGDTRGATVMLENVDVYQGPNRILHDISWRVEPGSKWAIVGPNGAGKSTLLQAITGQNNGNNKNDKNKDSPLATEGRITIGTKEQVGYLKQTAVAGSTRTIYDEVARGMTAIAQAAAAMERAAAAADLDALDRATTRFAAAGGYQQESQIATVLQGLGFATDQLHTRRCHELSGGWQMRVALAKLLLSEPTFCILDEPSNHLDRAAQAWLARYLRTYNPSGTLILVTHNVELLQQSSVVQHIAEIASHKLQVYKSCTYDQYLALKQERAAAAVAAYEKSTEKAAQLQQFIDRFGASATKAKAAQSRVKQLEKMRAQGLLDAPPDEMVATRFKPRLSLPDPPAAAGDVLLSLQQASVGYSSSTGTALVTGIDLDITQGMKLLIRGPNGAGKSTVLHSLRGTLPLLDGQRVENDQLRLGMFTQDLAQELDPDQTAVDIVTAYARDTATGGNIGVSNEQARAVLGGLGLTGEKSLRKLRELSGGEKARVALAMFALKPSNLYLLDEASNHLDVECVQVLSEALSEWGPDRGAMVVVSHDVEFCRNIEFTHVATVTDGGWTMEARNARESDWTLTDLKQQQHGASSDSTSTTTTTTPTTLDPARRKQAYNAPKRIAKLEQLVEETEGKIAVVDQEMLDNGSDVGKLVDLNKEKEALEAKVMAYMEEWEDLEELLLQVADE